MNTTQSEVSFEYDSGDTTRITLPHETGWRIVPATVCISPVNSVSRIVFDDGRSCTLSAPSAMIVPRNAQHCITAISGTNVESIWCHIRVDIFPGLDLLGFYDVPLIFEGKPALAFRQAIRDLNAANRTEERFDKAFWRQYHGLNLTRIILGVSTLKPEANHKIAAYLRIAPCLRLMQSNLSQHLTLADLAKSVNLSPSRFSGLFREITGSPPLGYFNRLRLRRAQEMLLNSAMSVGEIATKLGFFDMYHLSHSFKREFGLSPANYRKQILASLGRSLPTIKKAHEQFDRT